MIWLSEYVDNSRFQGLVIRRNADDLGDWIERCRWMYKGLGVEIVGNPVILRFPSGAIVRTGHLKDISSFNKYLGAEYQKILIEELTQIPTREQYVKLVSSCRTTIPELRPQVFCTTNPGGVGHAWVKELWVDQGPPNVAFTGEDGIKRIYIPATVDDNPVLMQADPDYVTRLDAMKFTDEALWQAWRYGSWDIWQGQVFNEWRRDKHVIHELPVKLADCRIYASMDWGFNDPTSIHWIAEAPENEQGVRHLYVFREMYGNGKTAEYWANEVDDVARDEPMVSFIMPHDAFSHLGGSATIASRFYAKKRLSVRSAESKSHSAKLNRQSLLHDLLQDSPDGKPYLQVLDVCRNLIRTVPSLPYSETKPEEIDDGAEDHCLAGDTPVLTVNGWKRIDELEGAKITGYDSEVITIEVDTGETLTCTPNHKILTQFGWTEAKDLEEEALILWSLAAPGKNIMANPTGYAVSTFNATENGYIELSGVTSTGLSQPGGISITATETDTTTDLRISNLKKAISTSAIILPHPPRLNAGLVVQTPEDLMQAVHQSNTHRFVKKVSKPGKLDKVYDISVLNPLHAFIANGFIVHNSYDSLTYGLFIITKGKSYIIDGKYPKINRDEGYIVNEEGKLEGLHIDIGKMMKKDMRNRDWRYQ